MQQHAPCPRWAPTPSQPTWAARNNRQFAKAPRKRHPFHSLAALPLLHLHPPCWLRVCWYLGPFGPLVALVERLVASVWATLFALCGYGKLIFMRSIYVFLLHTHPHTHSHTPTHSPQMGERHAPHHDIKIVLHTLRSATAAKQSPMHNSCHSPLQKADIANQLTVKCHELVREGESYRERDRRGRTLLIPC